MDEFVKKPGCIVLIKENNTDNCESAECRFVDSCMWKEENFKLKNKRTNFSDGNMGKMEGGVPVNR
jgi:hypothetical protein